MGNKDFNCSISVNKTPTEAFKAICKVTEWWSKNIEGETEKLNDVFTYRPGETWVTFKITECNPDKKIVWVLQDWKNLGPATTAQFLDEPGIPEKPGDLQR